MENLVIEIDDNGICHITVDLTKTIGESGSGQSDVVSCSRGNLTLANKDGTYRPEILNFSVVRRKYRVKRNRWLL